jgi:CRISPR-associated endoribonuclease Cas6
MPSRWEIILTGPAGAEIPPTAPQAVVSSWLDDPPSRSPEGAGSEGMRSTHSAVVRGWACGPFSTASAASPDSAEAAITMQVRLLDDSLEDRLLDAARPGRRIRLGTSRYLVTSPATLASRTEWADLHDRTLDRAWQVRFDTPACFRRGNRTSPWPAPESVARSLAERWQRLHPATAPPSPGPGSGQVWISDIDGHSQVQLLVRHSRHSGQKAAREVVSGFVGRIRYVCDRGSDAEASIFGALLSFAAYAGVGSHTTYGFGVVSPETTWQPPSVKGGLP